jgi:hypothetical protein
MQKIQKENKYLTFIDNTVSHKPEWHRQVANAAFLLSNILMPLLQSGDDPVS